MRFHLDSLAKHINIVIFLTLFSFHALNVAYVSQGKYVGYTFLYGLCVTAIYFLVTRGRAIERVRALLATASNRLSSITVEPVPTAIDIWIIVFPIGFFLLAGWVPVWEMIRGNDYYANSGLRNEFFGQLPAILKYAVEYMIRGAAPFWLLYSYMKKRPLFPVIFASCTMFALALVTKAYIVMLMFPLLTYQVAKYRFGGAFFSVLAIVIVLSANVILPDKSLVAPMRPVPDHATGLESYARGWLQGGASVADALSHRLLHGNGLTVTQWMDTYTTDWPLEKGCGYRWFAPFVPCDFEPLPYKIWLKYYPELSAKGLYGTVSVANYIYAYANFGTIGIIASGIGMGLLLGFLGTAIPGAILGVALNTSFLALSFEAPLTTLLNSGGWGIVILLTVIFLHQTNPRQQRAPSERRSASRSVPGIY
jgi:hypothetical protein